MWVRIFQLVLSIVDRFLDNKSVEKFKQAGRNEEKLEAINENEKRWEKANEIYNQPSTGVNFSRLLRPEDRTEANIRLLQDLYQDKNTNDIQGKSLSSEPEGQGDAAKLAGDIDLRTGGQSFGLADTGEDGQTRRSVREAMPLKFPRLPMPVKYTKPKRKISKVFLHCSASDNPAHDNPEVINAWHLERGFKGIGYHFFIDQRGEVFQCRDIEKIPAAQEGHNTGSIAICCGGLKAFSQAQLTALLMLCRRIEQAYEGNITFHGHREVEPDKTCPVYDYKAVLKLDSNGKMRG